VPGRGEPGTQFVDHRRELQQRLDTFPLYCGQ
jgi:hypothetical protein